MSQTNNNNQERKKYCMLQDECVAAFVKDFRQKSEREKQKKQRAEVKTLKDGLKTPAEWRNELQKVFNHYIRLRDADQPCISCGCDMSNRKGDASHYYAVSIAPSLRYNEDNVHLACVPCNQYKSGNLIEYGLRLPARIGQKRFDNLTNGRYLILKLSVTEIKEFIELYKSKIKQLKISKT